MKSIAVIGAGAWGTALAITAHRDDRRVVLWAHESDIAATVAQNGENSLFLPGAPLDRTIHITNDLATAAEADAVLLAAPAQHIRAVSTALAPHLAAGVPVVICAKGIEQTSARLMSEVLEETLPEARLAVLSGPTFAIEVARGLPAAATLACADTALGEALIEAIGTPRFRLYLSDDLIGAQIGGAVKNVLAIASGVVAGRRLGDNARAALIARGLVELARLATAKGGRPETVAGLSGLGDLILTCTSLQSRNCSLGAALGEGHSLKDVLAARRTVAEGVYSAAAVHRLAQEFALDMPISTAVDQVVNGQADIDTTIDALLARPLKPEGLAF